MTSCKSFIEKKFKLLDQDVYQLMLMLHNDVKFFLKLQHDQEFIFLDQYHYLHEL